MFFDVASASGGAQYRVFLTILSSWGLPRGLKGWLYADEVCEVQIFISLRGPLRVDYAPRGGKNARGTALTGKIRLE